MKTPFAITTLLVALLSAAALPVRSEPPSDGYEALFERALESIDWNFAESWAFTETDSGSDGEFVGRHDPRRPGAERWTLLSIDGREPTPEEARQYAERKKGKEGENDKEEDGDIDAMVEPGSLALVEETSDYWLLRFMPTDDEDDDEMGRKVMEQMDGTAKIIKDGHYLAYIDIRNTRPIRPKAGVKMKKLLTRITFGPAVDGGPVVMQSMDFAIKLSAFLVVRVDETQSLRYSDFEYAGDTD